MATKFNVAVSAAKENNNNIRVRKVFMQNVPSTKPPLSSQMSRSAPGADGFNLLTSSKESKGYSGGGNLLPFKQRSGSKASTTASGVGVGVGAGYRKQSKDRLKSPRVLKPRHSSSNMSVIDETI